MLQLEKMVSIIEFCCSKYDQFDQNSLMWWKFVSVMKIPHCDENWWKFINVMKDCQCDKDWLW